MGEVESQSSTTYPKSPRWSLQGMTALVTGGTRGIGYAVVEELSGFGAAVYTCSRKADELDECSKKWEGRGFRVSGSVCDLSAREQRQELLSKVSAAFDGMLNILVNNVGAHIGKPTIDFTEGEFSFLLATNFESAFHMCQLAHPLLKASRLGSIVFISAVGGVVATLSGSIYGATKGATNQLTKNLACEWAKDNIRVNSVAPWYINTSLVEHIALEKLIGRANYDFWARAARMSIANKKSLGYITSSKKAPAKTDIEAYEDWEEDNCTVQVWFLNATEKHVRALFDHLTTVTDI